MSEQKTPAAEERKQETPEEMRRRKFPHLCEVRDKLEAEKAEILKVVAPAREVYERKINDPELIAARDTIKKHNKRLYQIDMELAGCARAMGGKTFSGK